MGGGGQVGRREINGRGACGDVGVWVREERERVGGGVRTGRKKRNKMK